VCAANRLRSRTAMLFYKMKYNSDSKDKFNTNIRDIETGQICDYKFDSCRLNPFFVEGTKQIFSDAKLINEDLINWADKIICFEEAQYKTILKICEAMNVNKIVSLWKLDDVYDYMDTKLIDYFNKRHPVYE
jgi:predicted protein tyrosine phosphatase